jgi:hypothetical protein
LLPLCRRYIYNTKKSSGNESMIHETLVEIFIWAYLIILIIFKVISTGKELGV